MWPFSRKPSKTLPDECLRSGDVVRLKGLPDSPEMVIQWFNVGRGVKCVWFDGHGTYNAAYFDDMELTLMRRDPL